MRKISIIGNFDIKNNSYNGQTIKTRIVADELESLYGASEIKRIDTAGGKSVVLRLLFQLFGCVMGSRNHGYHVRYESKNKMGQLMEVSEKHA